MAGPAQQPRPQHVDVWIPPTLLTSRQRYEAISALISALACPLVPEPARRPYALPRSPPRKTFSTSSRDFIVRAAPSCFAVMHRSDLQHRATPSWRLSATVHNDVTQRDQYEHRTSVMEKSMSKSSKPWALVTGAAVIGHHLVSCSEGGGLSRTRRRHQTRIHGTDVTNSCCLTFEN